MNQIEAMKQALEALEDVCVLTDREWQAVHKNKANELRQAIAELEKQERQCENCGEFGPCCQKQEAVGVVGMDVSRPHISYGGQYLGQKQDTKTAMLFKDLEVGTKLYIHPQNREVLQAEGKHPAPCARHCEANAFQIVIRNLKSQLAAKPKREWVGLTDEEIEQGNKESWVDKQAWESAVWWAEAKLKEKNNG